MNRSTLYTLLPLIALSLTVSQAMGKATLHKDVAKNGEAKAQTQAKTNPREISSLRCWQEGKLLFEEVRLTGEEASQTLAQNNSRVFSMSPKEGSKQKIHLFETGTATCMYKTI